MEGTSDLQTKYNKIAAEYSKLRSQVPVLKKAVTEEQARCTELKEMLRVRDQCLRIAEAEVDSLNFRNQQLTCRVSILLQELEELKPQDQKEKSENEIEVRDLLSEIQKLQQELSLLKNSETKRIGSEERLNHSNKLEEQVEEHIDNDVSGEDLSLLIKDGSDSAKGLGGTLFEEISEYNEAKDSKEDKGYIEPRENTVRWSIQKALEHQLLESQQTLQKNKNEYELLNTSFKSLESKCKELEEKCGGISNNKVTATVKGNINFIPDDEAKAREREIKRCYQHRIDLVSNENHVIKSKLLTQEKEVNIMKMRLESEASNSSELSKKYEVERENLKKIKDELSTTVDNYNAQLSTMSDHVAVQNDIIEKQKETIENLQYKLDMALKRVKK